jgi:hypothetical protein
MLCEPARLQRPHFIRPERSHSEDRQESNGKSSSTQRESTDFSAVATFKAADPETSIDRFVVSVSMFPEATVVPNLLTRWVVLHPIEARPSPGPQHRHSQTCATGVFDNPASSRRKRSQRAVGSCVTIDSHSSFDSDDPATSTSRRSAGKSPGTGQRRGKRLPRRYTHGLAGTSVTVVLPHDLRSPHRLNG